MSGFVLTKKAMDDLKSIARYTQDTWGREQRNLYLSMLDRSFHDLAAHPLKGRDCGNLRQGYRKYGVEKHIVFYLPFGTEGIEIVRILHERMDVEMHFSD